MAKGDTTTTRSMPPAVRDLRDPWGTRTADVPGLTEELEQEFRFGQRISKTDRGYVMGGTMKGGSSSMWYPASKDQYHAYKRWQNAEGIHEARDDEAFGKLWVLLREREVALCTRRKAPAHARRRSRDDDIPFSGYGPLYADMHGILSALPEEHLTRPALERIQLGGWGPDAAKASAYHERAVLMYDFACRGARRTFLGLFLHELGHVHEVSLSEAEKDELYQGYTTLVEADAFYGVEFLIDAETRKLYQKFVFAEFLAETYMIYAACGEGLRRWIAAHEGEVRSAWESIYALFRGSFGGVEYE